MIINFESEDENQLARLAELVADAKEGKIEHLFEIYDIRVEPAVGDILAFVWNGEKFVQMVPMDDKIQTNSETKFNKDEVIWSLD